MEKSAPPRYGAYDFLEKWTLQELGDAESLAQGLRDSGAWGLVTRVLEEREAKIVDRILFAPNANPVQLERWRAEAAEIRTFAYLPAAIVEASKRKAEAFKEQQAREESERDGHE